MWYKSLCTAKNEYVLIFAFWLVRSQREKKEIFKHKHFNDKKHHKDNVSIYISVQQ